MNQKDYKAIAKILKKALIKCDSLDFKDKIIAKGIIIGIAKNKADYFEKEEEDITHCSKCDLRLVRGINCPKHGIMNIPFNREQFLEWCDVKE